MRLKGSWRRLSRTFSAKLAPNLVQEVRPFFRVNQKINVTTCCGLAGRYPDQGTIASHDALSARARIPLRPDLKGSSITICRRPQIVSSRNNGRPDLHFLRGGGLLHTLAAGTE
jgi:hypothetical protein